MTGFVKRGRDGSACVLSYVYDKFEELNSKLRNTESWKICLRENFEEQMAHLSGQLQRVQLLIERLRNRVTMVEKRVDDVNDQNEKEINKKIEQMVMEMRTEMEQNLVVINGRFDTLEQMVMEMRTEMKQNLVVINGRFDTLEQRLTSVEGRFDVLEQQLTGMETQVKQHVNSREQHQRLSLL